MSETRFADQIGCKRRVRTTTDSVLTGTLLEGPAGLLGVDLGGGHTTVYVHPDDVEEVYDHREGRFRTDGTHHLAAGLDNIAAQDWHRSWCVHEAGHAVVARALTLDVTLAYVNKDRSALVGGEVLVGPSPAQYQAVQRAAGPIAHSRYLRSLGYTHPLTAAAVEVLCGQGDHRRTHHMPEDGHIVWRRQADLDAAAMLAEAPLWSAVLRVADALGEAGPAGLDRVGIDAAAGEMPMMLTRYRPWGPNTPVEQAS